MSTVLMAALWPEFGAAKLLRCLAIAGGLGAVAGVALALVSAFVSKPTLHVYRGELRHRVGVAIEEFLSRRGYETEHESAGRSIRSVPLLSHRLTATRVYVRRGRSRYVILGPRKVLTDLRDAALAPPSRE